MASTFAVPTKPFIRAMPCPKHGLPPGIPCPARAAGSAPRELGSSCQYRLWVAQAAVNAGRWPRLARRLTGPLRSRFAECVDQVMAAPPELEPVPDIVVSRIDGTICVAWASQDDTTPPWDVA
jgi:hypothetical protein